MNDDFLKQMRKPPRREFADELYERINKPMQQPRYRVDPFVLRSAALTVAVVGLLLLATVLVSPAARAFAEEQIRQIGALIFRPIETESDAAPAAAPTALPTVPAPGDSNPPEQATALEDASRLAGFNVLAPAFLPEGYQVATVWSVDRQESGIYAVSSFRNAAKKQFLLLNQIKYAPGASFEQTYGDNEQLSNVSVRGTMGVWITGRLMTDPTDHAPDPQAEPQLFPTNWLVWQEGDITYALFGNGLDQTQMISIAESLGG